MNQEKIGKFIAELRRGKELTQEQLAEKIFMDRATISKWERGLYIANPKILLKLCEIFEVSISEMLAGERANKK